MPLRIPVVLSGTDTNHEAFQESTETVDVGKFGAKVLTTRRVKIGSLVSLRRANSEKAESFRVVHIGEPDRETQRTPLGIETTAIEDFWGHSFPPDVW